MPAMLILPPVRLRKRDWTHLMQLAFDARHNGHPVTPFLRAEIHRAIVIADEQLQNDIVHLNARVAYQLDKRPAKTRLVVDPNDYVPGGTHVSVLSSLGAALIGIRVGDPMPFLCTEGNVHLVTALDVHDLGVAGLIREEPGFKEPRHVSAKQATLRLCSLCEETNEAARREWLAVGMTE
jgi:regulator of nucleoside diphosphate kinase